MKFSTTVILLVILLALVIIYFAAVHKKPGTQEWLAQRKRVFRLDAEKVGKLEIVHGETRVVLEKKGKDQWRLVEPVAVRASSWTAQGVARDLESLEYTDEIPPKKQDAKGLAAYGLEPAAAVVTATVDGRVHTLRIGSKTPLGSQIYVMADNRRDVYAVGTSILDNVRKPINDWRDKDLLTFTRTDVNRVAVDRTDSPAVRLVRREGAWRLAAPVTDGADEDAIGTLFDKLDWLTVDTFVSDAPADLAVYGLDAPALAVSLSEFNADKKETTDHAILLGRRLPDNKDRVYVKVGGEAPVYAVNADALKDLSPAVARLRQKKFATFPTYAANRVVIAAPGRVVDLAKDTGDAWRLKSPLEGKTEGNTVRDFLDALRDAAIEVFVDTQPLRLADLGLDTDARTTVAVTLSEDKAGTKAERTLTFDVGRRTDDKALLYLKRGTDAFALAARTKLDETLALGDLAFRDRSVLDFEKGKAREVTVVKGGTTYAVSRPEAEDEWSMTAPVKAKADYSNVSNILWKLSSLRAKKLVAEKPQDLKPYGLDAPAIAATVSYKDKTDDTKTHTRTIQVGAKADEETYYARLADGDLVFTVDKGAYEDLDGELHQRRVMEFEKSKVTALALAHAGQEPFTFVKRDDKWHLQGRDDIEVNKDAVEDVLNDLDYLVTKRFATYGAADLAPYGLDRPRVTVTVKLEADERQILVGRALDEGKALAKTGTSAEVFELTKDEAAHLLRHLGDYLADPTATRPASAPAATTAPTTVPEPATTAPGP